MKVTLESTTKMVELNGVPARVWEGETVGGVKVFALITQIACHQDANVEEFQRDLSQCRAPSAVVQSFPMRMIL